jgi:UDP-glucose 4-epimerase
MRTLVTGGAGFVGSNLVDRMVRQGHEVVVVDNLSSGYSENLVDAFASGRVEFVRADVTSRNLFEIFAKARPEIVYHLAAQIDVRRSMTDPVFDAEVNILGTIQVALAALHAGCQRMIFASSGGTVYGDPDSADLPLNESHPLQPKSFYGVSKRVAEDYLDAYARTEELKPVTLRLGNVYGPRQDPHGEAGVVAIFGNRLLSNRPITVFGDGQHTRDYVFVDDVVDAFVAASEVEVAVGAKLNIGVGVETSVLKLYDTLRSVAGSGPEPTFAPPRSGEIHRNALDSSLAERTLGWRPKFDVKAGLERTWAWALRNFNAEVSADDQHRSAGDLRANGQLHS